MAPLPGQGKLVDMPGLKKRSISLSGHATSLALEPEFWAVLEAMAAADGLGLAGLIIRIDAGRGERPLASACRVAALQWRK
jgi:predicted DNA-binding ribbon-helix-helix protein